MSQASSLRSASRSMLATGLFLRRNLWIWPVVAALGLAAFGWWVRNEVENGTKKKQ